MENEIKLSPAQRAKLFMQATRQNIQKVAEKTGTESTKTSFEIPNARYLSKLIVEVDCTLTATHASETVYVPHEDSPYRFIDRIKFDLNNGFIPIDLSGEALYIYNIMNKGKVNMTNLAGGRNAVNQPLVASSGGTANVTKIKVELPLTLNDRDPIGLINLQNKEILANLDVTIGAKADLAPASGGFTFAATVIKIKVSAETFSIPRAVEARPALNVIKLLNEKTETMIAGENTIKLPVGLSYRRIGFICYDATPSRQVDSDITSTIDLMINQNDYPYRIDPSLLGMINAGHYGGGLPTGVYVLDFASMQGLRNLSGGRDYLDTENMTELWLRFTAGTAGTIKVFYEQMSQII